MSMQTWMVKTEMYAVGEMDQPPTPFKRNLGSAIVEIAINDYRNPTPGVHEHAREFLYPRTQAARDHFAWVLALAPGVDPRWVREMLDKRRARWDAQRCKRRRERAQ
jgi:hypothetical protein